MERRRRGCHHCGEWVVGFGLFNLEIADIRVGKRAENVKSRRRICGECSCFLFSFSFLFFSFLFFFSSSLTFFFSCRVTWKLEIGKREKEQEQLVGMRGRVIIKRNPSGLLVIIIKLY